MTQCTIKAGVCGFVTRVEADKKDNGEIALRITSDCPNIQKAAKDLTEIHPLKEIFTRANQTHVYTVISKYSPHPACVVPTGVLKAVEVEAKLALPREVVISFEE